MEPANQPTNSDAQGSAGGAQPNQQPAASQSELDVLRRQLETELGQGYTPENLVEKVKAMRRDMNEKQQAWAEFERNYKPMLPIVEYMQEDPAFAEHVNAWFQNQNQNVPSEIRSAIDPVQQRLSQLESRLGSTEANTVFDQLQRENYPVDEEIRARTLERMKRTGDQDVRANYFAVAGPMLSDYFRKQAAESQAARNAAGSPSLRGSAPSGHPDITSIPANQRPSYRLDRIRKAFEESTGP